MSFRVSLTEFVTKDLKITLSTYLFGLKSVPRDSLCRTPFDRLTIFGRDPPVPPSLFPSSFLSSFSLSSRLKIKNVLRHHIYRMVPVKTRRFYWNYPSILRTLELWVESTPPCSTEVIGWPRSTKGLKEEWRYSGSRTLTEKCTRVLPTTSFTTVQRYPYSFPRFFFFFTKSVVPFLLSSKWD